ncbi:MAG TPA: hypothetical protein VFK88_07120 [Gallionella sp.]|nr:hypothetical protein [Gallionella sp.]
MLHLIQVLSASASTSRGRLAQDGVKFRTLCGRCNNELLGIRYDPELIRFVNSVGTILKSSLILPTRVNVPVVPQKVMRAVVGHILAFGLDRRAENRFDSAMAEYFLDDAKSLPSSINFYYWVYPYQHQIIVRDAELASFGGKEPVVFKLLKFFPLAFFVTWEEPPGYGFNFEGLTKFGSCALDDEFSAAIDMKVVPDMQWPEAPSRDTFLLYGADAMAAKPYVRH